MKHASRIPPENDHGTATVEGMVVRTESGFHRVLVGDRYIVSRTPKRLLGGRRTATTAVVIGDHVRIHPLDDGTGMIQEILPRRNELTRGAAGGSRYLDVIAANLDLLIVVHSLRDPDFNANRVDRFLLLAEAAEISSVLVLNKLDLVDTATANAEAAPYEQAGYPVIQSCVRTGQGISDIRSTLQGRMSTLLGPSGVGKSSLLNAVQPGMRLRTGEISESTNKGRHTTTTAELLELHVGGWVADTPGLRELAIRDVDPSDVDWLYPELRPLKGECRFTDCTHREEPDCAVRSAVESDRLPRQRYLSYLRVYEDLLQEQRLVFD